MGLCNQPIYRWNDVFKGDVWWTDLSFLPENKWNKKKRNWTTKWGTLGSPLLMEIIKFSNYFKCYLNNRLLGKSKQRNELHIYLPCKTMEVCWWHSRGNAQELDTSNSCINQVWKEKTKISRVFSSPALWLVLVGSPRFHWKGSCAAR